MTHADKCILAMHCSLARGDRCNPMCPAFIVNHGFDGKGGRVATAEVPGEYRNVTLSNSPARSDQVEAYTSITSYVNTFKRQFDEEPERIKSFYLYSESPGTGKTTTAAAILNEYLIRHYIGSVQRNRQPLDKPAYFLDVNAWQSLFLGFNRSNVPRETGEPLAAKYYAMESLAKSAPFAVLDDIGVRSASEAFRGDLHAVINERVTNGMPTVYTSNVKIEELALIFDARLADRIRDMTATIPFVGGSKRGIRKTG